MNRFQNSLILKDNNMHKLGHTPPNFYIMNKDIYLNTNIEYKKHPVYCADHGINPYSCIHHIHCKDNNECKDIECKDNDECKDIECKDNDECKDIECNDIDVCIEHDIEFDNIYEPKEIFNVSKDDILNLTIKPKFKDIVKLSYKSFLKKDIPKHWD